MILYDAPRPSWLAGRFLSFVRVGLRSRNDDISWEMIDIFREMNDKFTQMIDKCREMIDICWEMIDNFFKEIISPR